MLTRFTRYTINHPLPVGLHGSLHDHLDPEEKPVPL